MFRERYFHVSIADPVPGIGPLRIRARQKHEEGRIVGEIPGKHRRRFSPPAEGIFQSDLRFHPRPALVKLELHFLESAGDLARFLLLGIPQPGKARREIRLDVEKGDGTCCTGNAGTKSAR